MERLKYQTGDFHSALMVVFTNVQFVRVRRYKMYNFNGLIVVTVTRMVM